MPRLGRLTDASLATANSPRSRRRPPSCCRIQRRFRRRCSVSRDTRGSFVKCSSAHPPSLIVYLRSPTDLRLNLCNLVHSTLLPTRSRIRPHRQTSSSSSHVTKHRSIPNAHARTSRDARTRVGVDSIAGGDADQGVTGDHQADSKDDREA